MISHSEPPNPRPPATSRPGLNPRLLLRRMTAAIERCNLQLDEFIVLTEAATGPYIVTPVLAAMAGADVFAVARNTRFAMVDQVRNATLELAHLAGVSGRIRVLDSRPAEVIGQADIVTNSGHVRPIDASMVDQMKRTAVIPLMYESWEFRESDLDLSACSCRGIAVAGTNERHPDVDVFSFLGIMAIKLLLDAGVAVHQSNVLLLCDNPFAQFIACGLRRAGATVSCAEKLPDANGASSDIDAIFVAMRPQQALRWQAAEAETIARDFPGAVVAQFWGDLDRAPLAAAGVPFWPIEEVPAGHMGILPSAVGPEPVIRLQCGGLKVGEVMAAAARMGQNPVEAVVQSGFGQALIAP
jgi:hypothetical protein